jgi:hypothetical protein
MRGFQLMDFTPSNAPTLVHSKSKAYRVSCVIGIILADIFIISALPNSAHSKDISKEKNNPYWMCFRRSDPADQPSYTMDERIVACTTVLGWSGDGNRAEGSIQRGILYALQAQYRKAIDDIGLGLSLTPALDRRHVNYAFNSDKTGAYLMRATAYHGLGDYAHALSDLDAAQPGLWGNEPGVFKMRGDIAMASKRYVEALKNYQEFAKVRPDDPSAAQNILIAQRMIEKPDSTPPPIPSQESSRPSEPSKACKLFPNFC